jgi:hypothetical protein
MFVGAFAALGILVGAGYAVHKPPALASNVLIILPTTTRDVPTQVFLADSQPVLSMALRSSAMRRLEPGISWQTLRNKVQVQKLTSNTLSITAQGKSAAEAEGIVNAVANSYVAYVSHSPDKAVRAQPHLIAPATTASGSSLLINVILMGILGGLAGLVIGAIAVLARWRGDRRLRERDEIANAVGVPVLASIPVQHPSDAGRWTRLLETYEPTVVHAWQLRTALNYLGQPDLVSVNGSDGDGFSITVLSLASDRGAFALGPQLAVFAASIGIPTALVIGPQQDVNATAALRSACSAPPQSSRGSPALRLAVADHGELVRHPGVKLTVVVSVVDGAAPSVADTLHTNATLLGISAGAVTAAQLAGVAVSAATAGRQIDGILVADPDPADHTTGRVPRLARPASHRMPTRMTAITTHTRRGELRR